MRVLRGRGRAPARGLREKKFGRCVDAKKKKLSSLLFIVPAAFRVLHTHHGGPRIVSHIHLDPPQPPAHAPALPRANGSAPPDTTNDPPPPPPLSSPHLPSDYLFKLLLIGDSGVGKSCLLLRFAVRFFLRGKAGGSLRAMRARAWSMPAAALARSVGHAARLRCASHGVAAEGRARREWERGRDHSGRRTHPHASPSLLTRFPLSPVPHRTTPTPSPTSPPSASTLYVGTVCARGPRGGARAPVGRHPPHFNLPPCSLPFPQKIRTVELDGKVVKLQIVRCSLVCGGGRRARPFYFSSSLAHHPPPSLLSSVGHRRPGALPHHHLILLPRRPRHHCECVVGGAEKAVKKAEVFDLFFSSTPPTPLLNRSSTTSPTRSLSTT